MEYLPQAALNYRLRFPENAWFGGNIPKTKIYEKSGATAAVKQKFVQQLDKIVWAYKLAPETINLPAGSFVKEIQVFELTLKTGIAQIDEALLRTLDKVISHPILYRIQKDNQCQYTMAYKRQHESDSGKWVVDDYFFSRWLNNNLEEKPLPQALNLQGLYEALLRLLLPVTNASADKKSELLPQLIARLHEIKIVQRSVLKLQNAIAKEKQFNRKVALNAELRTLQQQLDSLAHPYPASAVSANS